MKTATKFANTLQALSLIQDLRLNIFVPQLSTHDVTSNQNTHLVL